MQHSPATHYRHDGLPRSPTPSRQAQRAAASRKRRRARRSVLIAVASLLAITLLGIAVGHRHHQSATGSGSAANRTADAKRPLLRPPGPLPGYLLIADRGNNRMLLVDGAKRILWRYPGPDASTAMPFRFGDDTFFGPRHDRIISNQEDQHTIQVISFPAGKVLWRYGHVDAKGSAPGFLNTPDDAYLLSHGLVTVADAYNCRVLFISHAHRIVRQYGSGVCRHDPPTSLGAVNGATPLSDGGTLVSEINGSWIDDFSKTGRLRWSVAAPVSYPSDPQLLAPNRILLADYTQPGQAIIMTRTGRVIWRYGPANGPGALDHPSLATRIGLDLIAINDDYRHRVVVISMRTKKIVWQYGHTDVPGTAAGYLHTPDGLDLLGIDVARGLGFMSVLVRAPARTATPPAAGPGRLAVRPGSFRLPAAVEREVAVRSGQSILLAGGLDAAQHSTNGVFELNPTSGTLAQIGSVPEPFHDAGGALLGTTLFIFGGGAAQSSASVQAFNLRNHTGSIVAQLPRPTSDLAVATVGRSVYLIGGYDGRTPRNEIYRTDDGRHFTLVDRLPVGLRYPAVVNVGTSIVIAGGTSSRGPTGAVYQFDATSRHIRLIGQLAAPVAHASAIETSSGTVYILGGDTAGSISRVDLAAHTIRSVVGTVEVTDAGAVAYGNGALLIGGDVGGHPVATVSQITSP